MLVILADFEKKKKKIETFKLYQTNSEGFH